MAGPDRPDAPDTAGSDYAERLETLEGARWKRLLDVQAPYRWNLRRLDLGFTLDVGCGIGRNLLHLGGRGVGVDHNAASVETARRRGCTAYTVEEFRASPHAATADFDALLVAHVLEHMPFAEASALLGEYLPRVRPGGRVVLITPQQAGYRSDPTHVEYMDFAALQRLVEDHDLRTERSYSFPFPPFAGRFFAHNEFVVVARKPPSA
ncbi:MAG: class I SAM-dependent methyltransferase [Deltaproteobacteria bacterium]|nr:class I SAM-dependent methyltransferase [Deltaproteobacteria bacterium]MBW2415805.1 class I SAM-dependent methyltransferase [Deltaproteobacteria bacterium]